MHCYANKRDYSIKWYAIKWKILATKTRFGFYFCALHSNRTVNSVTLTACELSGRTSRFCGSWSRLTIHRCVRTCCRLMRWWGSMCSIRVTRSLAVDDTTSQLPPLSANLPSPMRARIRSAESSGPLANGVWLHTTQHPCNFTGHTTFQHNTDRQTPA